MTVKTITDKARRILQDTQSPFRWESAEIREAVQEGLDALGAIRPETRYVDGRLLDVVLLPEGDETELPVHRRYEEALVYFVVHKCYLDDDTDTVNAQLSDMYLGKFMTKAQM